MSKCTERNGSYVCQNDQDQHDGMHFMIFTSAGEKRIAKWFDAWSIVTTRKIKIQPKGH